MSATALVLAGHGSHISANTAGTVWGYVDRLRRMGVADEISACFWKEPPAFSQVLATLEARQVSIVPLFTANGYFTRQVIPAEIGLSGAVTRIGDKLVHYTAPVGQHPLLDGIVDQRLSDMVGARNLPPAQTAAAIIGHGTRRNPRSRDATRHQAQRIAAKGCFAEVVDAYLDDQPDIPSIYRRTRSRHIIALPYFFAEGSHVGQDLPNALGISGDTGGERVQDRYVHFTEPVGTDASICEVILALARTSGLPFEARTGRGAWDGFPRVGQGDLLAALEQGERLRFGPLRLTRERVWHSQNGDSQAFSSPAALRTRLRAGTFHPLPTRLDLPGGWHVALAQTADAHAVLETVYPGLVSDWSAQRRGALTTESLAEIGARQVGMFKAIERLPQAVIQRAIDEICGACLRQPSWHGVDREMPCRAACNWWLSNARKNEEKESA
ncbi:MAG: hypothetical protein OXG92_03995 [Chloroflexi bacterium]|nr:hypothetical protein [Chloroflexota bacterium]MCY3581105.1 hypothetical protein [Chloroflexota bacterium]MCY3715618.1 hypothetical protein [Chloroflexota bacterium]MDE2650644.1 hypothetical protein [Chloroflexota bacterium]MXX84008.1 hypothetical protein [Chloroflexota bacterium]